MRISYDYGKQYTLTACRENVSAIIDKMVRLAAKLTEAYASDIVHAANKLKDAIEAQHPLVVLLSFQEHSVDSYPMEDFDKQSPMSFGGSLQQWLLTVQYTNGVPETTFKRVEIAEN